MKILALLHFLAFLTRCILYYFFGETIHQFVDPRWAKFKYDYSKSYDTAQEEMIRYTFFQEDLKKIEEHDIQYEAGLVKWREAINQYSDLCEREYIQAISSFTNAYQEHNMDVSNASDRKVHVVTGCVPCTVDWSRLGYVSPVRNQLEDQKTCASSYAIATVAAIESHYAIQNNEFVHLSAQEVLDCSKDYDNKECNGGSIEKSFMYVVDNGLGTEDSYPQTEDGACYSTAPVANVTDFPAVTNEKLMLDAIGSVGPVAVTVEFKHFRRYVGGIYQCPNARDEGPTMSVLVVGYGMEKGVPYWLLKNSLGEKWGENGYFRILRCDQTPQCGIYDSAYYPVIRKNGNDENKINLLAGKSRFICVKDQQICKKRECIVM